MSEEMSIKKELLANLTQGNFYVKMEGKTATHFKTPNLLLDNNNSMTPDQWENIKNKQIQRYYLPISKGENQENRSNQAYNEDKNTDRIKPDLPF